MAWQPDWKDSGIAQGFPRFGLNESKDGDLSYMYISTACASGTPPCIKTWELNNAMGLVAAGLAAIASLAF